MKIEIDDGKPTRVSVVGNLLGEHSKELEQRLMPLVSEPEHDVWVDLAEIARVDSQALGVLVSLACRSNITKGKLTFARPSLFVEEVLRVTQLNRFLNISGDEETLS